MSGQRLRELETVISRFRMRNCMSMQTLANQGINRTAALQIARQYYHVNAASPPIMAAGISNIWDEGLRFSLLSNLFDECGAHDIAKSHVRLFQRFVDALGLDPARIPFPQPESKARKLIDRYLTICREGPDYRALAVLHSFEDVFWEICGLIHKGLQKTRIVSEHATEFFPLHAIVDVGHAKTMRTAMLAAANSDDRWHEALELVQEGAQLLYDLFDSIAQSVLNSPENHVSQARMACG